MQLAIASGKGGTGKTTLASNLAWAASQFGYPVTYVDCDVEEPNGHLFLRPNWLTVQSIDMLIPQVDVDKCSLCGRCGEFCCFGAIVCVGQNVKVFSELCHSCGGCALVCPEGAIWEAPHSIGVRRIGASGKMCVVDGALHVGQHLGPPAIRSVKEFARTMGATRAACQKPADHPVKVTSDSAAKKWTSPACELRIIDSPPGTSCSMVEAVRGSDLVLLVTEPTPFGMHDLEMAVDTISNLDLPMAVVINRSGPNDRSVIDFCRQVHISILGKLRDDRRVAEAYSDGCLACEVIADYRQRIEQILDRTLSIMEEPCKN